MNCCLCGSDPAPHTEVRPTGRRDAPETWCFCSGCWRELQAQRADRDPEHALRAALFFRFIAGDPRLAGWRLLDKDDPAAGPVENPDTKNIIDMDNSMSIESRHHEAITNEHPRGPSQETQETLLRDGTANDRYRPEADRGFSEEGRGEDEKITRMERVRQVLEHPTDPDQALHRSATHG